jgi:hypothetical protein
MVFSERMQHLKEYLASDQDLSRYWERPKHQIRGYTHTLNGCPVVVLIEVKYRRDTGAEFITFDGTDSFQHLHIFRREVERHTIEDETLQGLLRKLFHQAERALDKPDATFVLLPCKRDENN